MPREVHNTKTVDDLMSPKNQLIFFFVSWLIAISLCVIEKLHARNRRSADPSMAWHQFCSLFVNKDLKELSDGRAELLKDQSRSQIAAVSTTALAKPLSYLRHKRPEQLYHWDFLKDVKAQGRVQSIHPVSRITRGWRCRNATPGQQAIELGAEPPLAFLICSSLVDRCITIKSITHDPMLFFW